MADVLWLEQNGIRLGEISITERDMWYFSGTFEAFGQFETVQKFFEQAHQLVEQKRLEEWIAFYKETVLDKGFYLLRPSGEKMTKFILHIHDQKAWGRLS
jgi:hypothetical protein